MLRGVETVTTEKLTVSAMISCGAMGQGWEDSYQAALHFGHYVKKQWLEETAEYIERDVEHVDIEIDILRLDADILEVFTECELYEVELECSQKLTSLHALLKKFRQTKQAKDLQSNAIFTCKECGGDLFMANVSSMGTMRMFRQEESTALRVEMINVSTCAEILDDQVCCKACGSAYTEQELEEANAKA